MRLRTIDLFCGAGGSSYGARRAGAEIVAGFDMWSTALKCFALNFPGAITFDGDIRDISAKEAKKQIGEVDLILASPECTNHSVAKGNRERSERSRMTAFEVVRFAKEFDPKFIVIENVIQMETWSQHGLLLEKLWELGYYVKNQKIDSKYFDVPQSRKRLFLVCAKEIPNAIRIKKKRVFKPAYSIIDDSDRYKYTPLYSKRRAENTIERAERAISALGSKVPFILVYYGSDGSGGWQTVEKPLRTITTIDRFAYVKPTSDGHMMRMLQPEELKLAMGYGKRFKLGNDITRREKVKLMGNGVCPPVMQAIVKAFRDYD